VPDTFAGLSLHKPIVMGILNVTPDSFSDGGEVFAADAAIRRGFDMVADGAAILDIGGESTRPGAEPVSIDEEIRRVVPVIEGLCDSSSMISIDTRHPQVMEAAVEAGAGIINDVTALSHDENSVKVAANLGVPVMLMHMQGRPETMQDAPHYDNVVEEVCDYLKVRARLCEEAGISSLDIAIDPGIGFGKTVQHNLQVLNHIEAFTNTGYPVVLGVSRKSFIGKIAGGDHPQERLAGSLAAAVLARQQGAQIFRVHDVAETMQALTVADAMSNANKVIATHGE
jgi:dihydropteroate synthase